MSYTIDKSIAQYWRGRGGVEMARGHGSIFKFVPKNLLKYTVVFKYFMYHFRWSLIFVKGSLGLSVVRMHVSVCAHNCIVAGFLQFLVHYRSHMHNIPLHWISEWDICTGWQLGNIHPSTFHSAYPTQGCGEPGVFPRGLGARGGNQTTHRGGAWQRHSKCNKIWYLLWQWPNKQIEAKKWIIDQICRNKHLMLYITLY